MARTQIKTASATGRDRGGRASLYVVLALGLPVAIVLLPSFIVLAALMAPTLVAWLIDPRGERFLTATVGSLNFAGSLYLLTLLWNDNHDVAHAVAALHNVYGWLIAYSAAAMGYGIHYFMPTLSEVFVRLRADAQLAQLDREMQALVEEWGEEVGRPPEA